MKITPRTKSGGLWRWQPFTLVEVVISTFLTIIVLASASSLLAFNLLAVQTMDARKATSNIAKNRIETLRALTFADLVLAEESDIRVNAQGIPDANGWFLRTTAVSDPYYNSRIVLVRVVCEKKYRRPRIVVDISTILMDQNLVVQGGT